VTDAQPETVTDAQPETVTDAQPETVTDAQPETVTDAQPETVTVAEPNTLEWWFRAAISLVIVLALVWFTRFLDANVPKWLPAEQWVKAIEFPVYAILVGLAGGAVLGMLGLRGRFNMAFRTEFYIKTGLVLLGASINLAIIAKAAGPAIAQSTILITCVFFATWFLAGLLRLDMKLRAVLAASVSICGISAAIAAAGAVAAKKEQLAYVASLVILFALPSIFIQPWLAQQMGLSQAVAGAWIGGNIDTTAAVAAAGSIMGEDALKIATIVKTTQNALMGVVAFLLAAYWVYRVEKTPGASVGLSTLWNRFPKFILGFIAASAIATWYINSAADPKAATETLKVANELRIWFFALAFVCIGLEFRVTSLREAGVRPIIVFAGATILNLVLALALASFFFADFTLT
jgi:Predicted membrane protein